MPLTYIYSDQSYLIDLAGPSSLLQFLSKYPHNGLQPTAVALKVRSIFKMYFRFRRMTVNRIEASRRDRAHRARKTLST